jgi:hypothetical protein
MVVLCIIAISLLVPIGVLVSKIKNIVNQGASTELAQFESTQSKQHLKLHIEAASEEAAIKREGGEPQAEE